jgi:hypothetical protein
MATRFYFDASAPAEVSPTYSASWTYTTEAGRYRLNRAKENTALTNGAIIGPWAIDTSGGFSPKNALDRQYVSPQLAAGNVFTSGAGTVSMQLMAREVATNDNVNKAMLRVSVVSSDGATVRATILTLGNYFANAEFSTSMRNVTFANGDTLTGSYTTVDGDRLVIEVGYATTDTNFFLTPEAQARWGDPTATSDLPVDETQTTDGVAWIEFSNTLTFYVPPSGGGTRPNALMLMGVG